jgi:hypothetical protein
MRTDIAGSEDMYVTQAPLGSKEMRVGVDFSRVLVANSGQQCLQLYLSEVNPLVIEPFMLVPQSQNRPCINMASTLDCSYLGKQSDQMPEEHQWLHEFHTPKVASTILKTNQDHRANKSKPRTDVR